MVRLSAALACLTLATLCGCASSPGVATPVDTGPAQPDRATYSCGEAGAVTIEHAAGSIRMTEPDGVVVVLPASPPGQRNRFVEGIDAVVIEGREALVMHGNHEPLTCTR